LGLCPRAEQWPNLGREPGHRLLVIGVREAGDQVVITELEERRNELRHLLRRSHRLARPGRRLAVGREDSLEDPERLLARVADDDHAEPCRALDLGWVTADGVAMAQEDGFLPTDLLDPAADIVRIGVPRDELERHLLAAAPD